MIKSSGCRAERARQQFMSCFLSAFTLWIVAYSRPLLRCLAGNPSIAACKRASLVAEDCCTNDNQAS